MVVKRNGFLDFWWVSGGLDSEEEFGRDWSMNLGLASSSKNSMFGQTQRSQV